MATEKLMQVVMGNKEYNDFLAIEGIAKDMMVNLHSMYS